MTNKIFAGLRRGLATVFILGLAACSDDTPTGGLLNQDGDSGGVDPDAEYVLTLEGPTCVTAGRTSDPFTALLTTTEGDPVPDVFVLIEPFVGDEAAGSITATAPDGRQRVGGANTDDDGEMVFTYRAPTEVRTEINVSLEGTAVVDDDVRGEDQLSVRVPAESAPTVRVQGPVNPSTGNRVASGSLEVAAGELASEFLVTVTSSGGCGGTSQPVRGAVVDVETSLTNSVIRQTEQETLLDGTAVFDYLAPSQVSARTADVLTVFGSTGGGTTEREYTLFVLPGPPDPYARLTVRGPTSVPAGTTQSGYIATAEQVQEDAAGNETVTALPDVKINLSSSDSGTFTVQTNNDGLRGVTDEFGIVRFGFRPAASGNAAQTVDLTAAIATSDDAEAQALCEGTDADCTDTIEVQVQADTFTFTAPDFGDSALVGANNAVNLAIDWRDGTGAGVTGCVDLSTTFNGASGTSFGLIINNDPVTATQTRRARVVNGAFERPHALYSDRSGFVTVIAEDNRDCESSPTPQLEATTGVQFQDEICTTTSDGRNCVDLQAPLRVLTSPDDAGNQRTATLTFEVRNNAFQPVDGAQVTFEIITAASAGDPNERVFPGGGTTNANGVATSRYFVPTFNPPLGEDEIRTVDVRACVRRIAADGSDNGQVCSTRRIEIVAPPTT
ncbi:hypothetical protein [uncultured Abyssibacter sp.]|uniref:hypothetical protein n=1 Tax=uncultured Abyssibacter sp. TaxID=2320202 RepID=UPI0032B157F1